MHNKCSKEIPGMVDFLLPCLKSFCTFWNLCFHWTYQFQKESEASMLNQTWNHLSYQWSRGSVIQCYALFSSGATKLKSLQSATKLLNNNSLTEEW